LSKNLKIVFVTPSFPPVLGGVELYVLNLGKELIARGNEVHVLTPDSVMGRKLRPGEEMMSGIHVHRIRTLFDVTYRLKLWPSLKKEILRLKPDLVHVYSHDLYSIFALSACKNAGIPILLTTYGPFRGQSERGLLGATLLSLYDQAVSPRILRGVTGINVRYPELSGWLTKMKVPARNVNLEPSAIPSEYLTPADGRNFREQIGIGKKIVLYLGRISRQKGVHNLIEATRSVHEEMDDLRLLLIGPDFGDVDLTHLPPWIHNFGATLSAEFEMEAIAASDLFVMPSRFEGFSQAVMKAIAQGKRVIATDVGGLPYEVGYGRFGKLVEFGNIEQLAHSISEHFNQPIHRDSSSLRDYASQFTFRNAADRISSQYHRLVS